MKIPLIDLKAQYNTIRTEIQAAINRVCDEQHFILGPEVKELEREVAGYLQVKRAVGVASGTDALVLAMRALGIGRGDEVIVPAFTFFATAEAVMLVAATPVFVDIRSDTYCLDVAAIAEKITKRTKAIIAVHLFGHPTDMTSLLEIAQARELRVIEDNAQAFGGVYRGRRTGGIGDVGCLSFYPSKNLGGFGDGGMVVTNQDDVADRVSMLRTHGWKRKYDPQVVGYNSRLDELQAAILRVKLRHVDKWNKSRGDLAKLYSDSLPKADVGIPCEGPSVTHVYHLYVIRVKDRDSVQQSLKKEGIASSVYYPKPLHLTEPFRSFNYSEGSFPVSEQVSKEILALPLYPEMDRKQLHKVVQGIRKAVCKPKLGREGIDETR